MDVEKFAALGTIAGCVVWFAAAILGQLVEDGDDALYDFPEEL